MRALKPRSIASTSDAASKSVTTMVFGFDGVSPNMAPLLAQPPSAATPRPTANKREIDAFMATEL